MNYLAHAWLSFHQPEILVGNMISDFVKGKKQFEYPLMIQKGIQLHRAIDNYTDTHPVTQEVKSFFRPRYRLYSGAFIDVVYDHFLANDPNEFATENNLLGFAAETYELLEHHLSGLPAPFQAVLPNMKTYNWLYHYRFKEGIRKSFGGLVKRAAYLTESESAFEIFNRNYEALQSGYNRFFPSLKKFTTYQFEQLLNS